MSEARPDIKRLGELAQGVQTIQWIAQNQSTAWKQIESELNDAVQAKAKADMEGDEEQSKTLAEKIEAFEKQKSVSPKIMAKCLDELPLLWGEICDVLGVDEIDEVEDES